MNDQKTPHHRASKLSLILTALMLVGPGLGGTSRPYASADSPSSGASEFGASASEYFWSVTSIDGAMGPLVATVPQTGAELGSFFLVHPDAVSLMRPDGSYAWSHGRSWFLDVAGLTDRPGAFFAAMGYSHENPISVYNALPTTAGHPIAVGDLNGDGEGDVAVAHYVGWPDGTSVLTVLDGSDGAALWSHPYPGVVRYIAIQDGVLVVAHQTGPQLEGGGGWWRVGADGSTNTLYGYSQLNAAPSWSIEGAPWASYLALATVGSQHLAYAQTTDTYCQSRHEPGCPEPDGSDVSLLNVATGDIEWSTAVSDGYVRHLREDEAGDRLIAATQRISRPPGEPSVSYGTQIGAVDVASGSIQPLASFPDELPAQLLVADATGDELSDIVLAVEATAATASHGVKVLDGRSAALLWSFTSQDEILQAEVIPSAQGPVVIVARSSSTVPMPETPAALGLDGATGSLLWSNDAPSNRIKPKHFSPYVTPDVSGVVGVDMFGNIRVLDVGTGEVLHANPVFGRIYDTAFVDTNGDGVQDVISAGESGGVFAVDGRSVHDPSFVWVTPVTGQVHAVRTVELPTGPAIVVASSLVDGDGVGDYFSDDGFQGFAAGVAAEFVLGEVSVLDASTGMILWQRQFPEQFVWDLTVGDVNGDGSNDIVVPTRAVTVLDALTGDELWTYDPYGGQALFSNAVIGPGERVLTQYRFRADETLLRETITNAIGTVAFYQNAVSSVAVALDGGTGTPLWIFLEAYALGHPALDRGVASGADLAWAEGYTAAFSYIDDNAQLPLVGSPIGERIPRVAVLDVRTGEKLAESTGSGGYHPSPIEPFAMPTANGYLLKGGILRWGFLDRDGETWEGEIVSNVATEADLGPLGRVSITSLTAPLAWPVCKIRGECPNEAPMVRLPPGTTDRLPGSSWLKVKAAALEEGEPDSLIGFGTDSLLENDLNALNGAGFGFGSVLRLPGIAIFNLDEA